MMMLHHTLALSMMARILSMHDFSSMTSRSFSSIEAFMTFIPLAVMVAYNALMIFSSRAHATFASE